LANLNLLVHFVVFSRYTIIISNRPIGNMSQVQQKKVLKNHRFKNLNDKIIVFI